MYIKASTASERQQWLVALGSSKACLTQGNTPDNTKKNQNHGKEKHPCLTGVRHSRSGLDQFFHNICIFCLFSLIL